MSYNVVQCYVVNIEASVTRFLFIDVMNFMKKNLYSFILMYKNVCTGCGRTGHPKPACLFFNPKYRNKGRGTVNTRTQQPVHFR